MELKGKKVTVVGLGASGQAACELLLSCGAEVSVTDCCGGQGIAQKIDRLKKKGVKEIETGAHTRALIAGRDLIVVSPGVGRSALPFCWAQQERVPVIGEIELAWLFCPCQVAAITGTNGKTTVTTLLGKVFLKAGKKPVVCGNIGRPFSACVGQLRADNIVVLEVSSFQLETIDKFSPRAAVLLNISEDHLDRHKDLAEYITAKGRIFSRQTKNDWAVLNRDDPYQSCFAEKARAKVVYFSQAGHLNTNQQAVLTVSALFGVPRELAGEVVDNFKGLEHRMEDAAEIKGVKFVNDSKATNVHSCIWALNSLKCPVVLIAGGKDKGGEYSQIRDKIRGKVKAMVLIGQAKERIKAALADLVPISDSETLEEAAQTAFSLADKGDCVLLSPMCASFDMFSNYEQRGRVFKKAVKELV